MNRICKSALFTFVLFGLAIGAVAACGGGDDDHSDHEHKPGEKHDDHK